MTNRSHYLLIILIIIIFSFPSIGFSELKTVEGEYCQIYLGDLKNKKELEEFRQIVKMKSIQDGLKKIVYDKKLDDADYIRMMVKNDYLDKFKSISHTQRKRNICERVQVSVDVEVLKSILEKDILKFDDGEVVIGEYEDSFYCKDILNYFEKEKSTINLGLLTEIKGSSMPIDDEDKMVTEQEDKLFKCLSKLKDKVNIVERKSLNNIIQEQKLSVSGITDTDTVKVGKILNLNFLILETVNDKRVTIKVLKIETGELVHLETYVFEHGTVFKPVSKRIR